MIYIPLECLPYICTAKPYMSFAMINYNETSPNVCIGRPCICREPVCIVWAMLQLIYTVMVLYFLNVLAHLKKKLNCAEPTNFTHMTQKLKTI